jgi:DNA repair protein RadC
MVRSRMMTRPGKWVVRENPRENLRKNGPGYLSDEELLQVLLGTGVKGCSVVQLSRRVLACLEENVTRFREDSPAFLDALVSIRGMGSAKAAAVAAFLELSSRLLDGNRRTVRDTGDVIPLISSLSGKKQEYFIRITLNGGNRLISKSVVTIGLLDQALVHPREVFAEAIRERAAKVIVAHNHPAGDNSPSKEDVKVTENLAQAASILGIEFLDHIIITETGYFSFREEGFL